MSEDKTVIADQIQVKNNNEIKLSKEKERGDEYF